MKASTFTHFSNSRGKGRGKVEVEEGEIEAIEMASGISKPMMINFRVKLEDKINILTNPK